MATLTGTVQSGGTIDPSNGTSDIQPLGGVTVTLYLAGPSDPVPLGSATTNGNGTFSLNVTGAGSGTLYYAMAQVSEGVVLAAVLGTSLPASVVINELTTVGAAYSLARLSDGDRVSGSALALKIAAGMSANIVDAATGQSSQVLVLAPNADQTNALRATLDLANLVASSVRNGPEAVNVLLTLTSIPNVISPENTFQALVSMARYPGNQVQALYKQALVVQPYTPGQAQAPDAWTVAVKVNNTGDVNNLFGGPANFAFDEQGYAWIPNNVVQGTPNSGHFIVCLKPDGTPSDGSDGRPVSPVLGGGLTGPGWGVTISPITTNVWVGNFGWGDPDTQYPAYSVSEFTLDGTPVSDTGYDGGTDRVQAIVADKAGNIWMASFENDSVVVFRNGDAGTVAAYQQERHTRPFGVAIADDGTAWVTNAGGLGWPVAVPGGVSRYRLTDDGLEQLWHVQVGKTLKVVALDEQGTAWVASGGDSTVYRVREDGTILGAYSGVGGMDAPWGIAVDGENNVFVANFGKMGHGSDYTNAGLTKLAGESQKNRDLGLMPGDPLSPDNTGFTLPNAGDPVLLANGDPLYGPGADACYSPLMRQTSCQIDQAGNVWVVNNWKPDFDTDYPTDTGNPGGDGVVIFLGLAAPPRSQWAS